MQCWQRPLDASSYAHCSAAGKRSVSITEEQRSASMQYIAQRMGACCPSASRPAMLGAVQQRSWQAPCRRAAQPAGSQDATMPRTASCQPGRNAQRNRASCQQARNVQGNAVRCQLTSNARRSAGAQAALHSAETAQHSRAGCQPACGAAAQAVSKHTIRSAAQRSRLSVSKPAMRGAVQACGLPARKQQPEQRNRAGRQRRAVRTASWSRVSANRPALPGVAQQLSTSKQSTVRCSAAQNIRLSVSQPAVPGAAQERSPITSQQAPCTCAAVQADSQRSQRSPADCQRSAAVSRRSAAAQAFSQPSSAQRHMRCSAVQLATHGAAQCSAAALCNARHSWVGTCYRRAPVADASTRVMTHVATCVGV